MEYKDAEAVYNQIASQTKGNAVPSMDQLLSAINVFIVEISTLIDKGQNQSAKISQLWYRIAYLTSFIPELEEHINMNDKASDMELQLKSINYIERAIDKIPLSDQEDILKLYFNLCINTINDLLSERCDLMKSIELCDKLCSRINHLSDISIISDINNKINNLAEKFIDYNIVGKIKKQLGYYGEEIARLYFEKICNSLWKLSGYKGTNNAVQGYFNTAEKYKQKGELIELKQSLKYINYAIQIDPTDAQSYKFRGYIYRMMGISNIKNTEKDFKQAISINNFDLEAYYFLGVIYNEMKKYDKAIDYLSKVLDKFPDCVEANNAISISYRNTDNTDKALFHLNRALRNNPDYTEALTNRAQTYIQQKRLQEAIIDCNTVILKMKNDDIAYDTLGLAYAVIGDYDKAHFNFSKAIEINQNNNCARGHIKILEQEGIFPFHNMRLVDDDVVTKLDRTDKINEIDVSEIIDEYQVDFIVRELLRKKIATAKTKICADVKPYDIVHACTLIDNKIYEDAIDILQKDKKENGNRADVCFNLGLAYLKRGNMIKENLLNKNEIIHYEDTKNAIGCFNLVFKIKNEKANEYITDTYYYRSLAWYFWGEIIYSAKKDIEEYRKLKKCNNTIDFSKYVRKNNTTIINKDNEEYYKTITYYKKILENDSLNLDAMGILGRIYIQLGNYREALDFLNPVIHLYYLYDNSIKDMFSKDEYNKDKIDLINYYLEDNNITSDLFVFYLLLRSKANYSLGIIANAYLDCEEALKKNPDNAIAKKLIECYTEKNAANGIIMELFGNDHGKDDYDSLKEEISKGIENAKSGEFEEAIDSFSSVIRRKPEYADAYRMRAFAYLGVKDKESALAGFKEANQINKKDYVAMRWITKIQLGELVPDIAELFRSNQV
jgi:tetratricopeptide (TPR) repeat protein